MTIDKIKQNLPESIFNYWTTLIDYYPKLATVQRMQQARNQLTTEIEHEIFGLPEYYIYELKLLNYLLQ